MNHKEVRWVRKASVLLCSLFLASILLAACGGGGGEGGGGGAPAPGGNTTTTTTLPPGGGGPTITGSVQAPNGKLAKAQPKGLFQWFVSLFTAKEGIAQTTGLLPVPDINILVFQIDGDGTPVTSAPIAKTMTDANGNYSVTLPTEMSLSSNLIIQASTSTTPSPICTKTSCPGNNMNCPAVQTTVNINPAAELATRAILQDIAAKNGTLSNFTNAEVTAFVTLVQTFAQDPSLIGLTIEQTITNINNALQGLINVILGGIDQPGEAFPPPSFTGTVTYNIIDFDAEMGSSVVERFIGSGKVAVNTTDKTFSGAISSNRVGLAEACPTSGGVCDRNFIRTISPETSSVSGTYFLLGNGLTILTNAATATVPNEINLGLINPTGTIIVVPIHHTDGAELLVAVQEGSGLSAADLAGTFNFAGLGSSFAPSSNASGVWSSFSSKTESGILTFTGSNFNANQSTSVMQEQINCAISGTGCSLTATLSATPSTNSISGPFTVSPTGAMTFTPSGGAVTGAVSSDKDIVWVKAGSGSTGELEMVLATRQGSGMTNANLNGTYNLAAFEDDFDTSAGIGTFITMGTVTFDGNGGWSALGFVRGIDRTECQGSGPCPAVSFSGETKSFSKNGTYNVNSDGTFTLVGAEGAGAVSSDGSVFVLHQERDNQPFSGGGANSGRIYTIGVKQ